MIVDKITMDVGIDEFGEGFADFLALVGLALVVGCGDEVVDDVGEGCAIVEEVVVVDVDWVFQRSFI